MTEPRAELLAAVPPVALVDFGRDELTDPLEEELYMEAAFMGLDHEPATEEAMSLCRDVAERIQAWERRQRARAYGRRGKLRDFNQTVGFVVGDLLSATAKRPRRWLFRPLARDAFTGHAVGYRTFHAIFNAMRTLALIERKPGYFDHAEGGRRHGRCTRVRPRALLLAFAREHGIDPTEANAHFRRLLPSTPLVLHASSKRYGHVKVDAPRMHFAHTERTRALETELHEINRFIRTRPAARQPPGLHPYLQLR